MKKPVLLILVIALTFCVMAGCASNTANGPPAGGVTPAPPDGQITEANTRTLTDLVGRVVEIPANVEKIVVLGNTPRMITYLGLAGKVVGYSGSDPENVTPVTAYAYATKDLWANLAKVGTDSSGMTDYYPEEIIRVNPDVILCSYAPDLADEIQTRTGKPTVSVPTGTLFGKDYEEALRLLADVCGIPEKAEEVIAFINDSLEDLNARTANIPAADKPTILGAAASFKGGHGIEGVYVNSPIFSALNANDVTKGTAESTGGVLVDREQIIGWNPEYIIFDANNFPIVKEDYKNNPDFYALLSAVQNSKLYQTPNATAYYSNVEIPIVTAYYIGGLIFPEQFGDIVFQDKASEVFSFFLGDGDYLDKLETFGVGYSTVTLGDY